MPSFYFFRRLFYFFRRVFNFFRLFFFVRREGFLLGVGLMGMEVFLGSIIIKQRVKMISKQKLAMLYFPEKTRRNALDTLNRWMNNCHGLREQLEKLGYKPKNRMLTKRQVEVIYEFLGEI